jgi:hypothetical protein
MEVQMKLLKHSWLCVPMIAGISLASTGAARPGDTPQCVVAAAWVKNHPTSLPTNLKNLSAFSSAYRRQIWVALPMETKRAIVHEQMQYYRTSPDLTNEQRAFVTEIDTVLDQYFSVDKRADFAEKYHARMIALMGKPLAKRVFATIGVGKPTERHAKEEVDCECATDRSWCENEPPNSGNCANANCLSTPWGCGDFGIWPCDGTCE